MNRTMNNNKPPVIQLAPKAAEKYFHELQIAELRFRIHGEPHRDYLRTRIPHYLGQTRRELQRLCKLSPERAAIIIEMFFVGLEEDMLELEAQYRTGAIQDKDILQKASPRVQTQLQTGAFA
jgi:hypothetical protein